MSVIGRGRVGQLRGRGPRANQRNLMFKGPIHAYPDIFENGEFSSPQKNTRPHVAYLNHSPPPVHKKGPKRWKYDSIPSRACVIAHFKKYYNTIFLP